MKELFEQLNYPGPARLKRALRNQVITFTNAQVEKLTEGESVRQIQRAAPPLKGKVASHYQHYEWQADLIVWTTAPSSSANKMSEPEKYILVVQDVFSRKLWAEAMVTKQPDEVLRAFKKIIEHVRVDGGVIVNRLTTAAGGEIVDVKKFMTDMNRVYRVRTSLRSLATLDNAIGLMKKALARDMRKHKTDDWAARLDKVVRGLNESPTRKLSKWRRA